MRLFILNRRRGMTHPLLLSLALIGQTTQPSIPAEWQRQLDGLAKEVERDLSVPATRNGEDLRAESRLMSGLLLAGVWPRPEFKPHLLRVLKCRDPGLIGCAAAALLAYEDPALRAEVTSMQSDDRPSGAGCIGSSVGRDIQG